MFDVDANPLPRCEAMADREYRDGAGVGDVEIGCGGALELRPATVASRYQDGLRRSTDIPGKDAPQQSASGNVSFA